MATNLTEAFIEGYNASQPDIDNPFIYSSPNWLAYKAGAEWGKHGTEQPTKCLASRGYTLRFYTVGNGQWQAIPNDRLTQWQFMRKG